MIVRTGQAIEGKNYIYSEDIGVEDNGNETAYNFA